MKSILTFFIPIVLVPPVAALIGDFNGATVVGEPEVPANVRFVEASPAHLRITWDSVSERKGIYRIWRRPAGTTKRTWRLVGEVSAGRTHFDDGGLDAESVYEHRVTVFHGRGESPPSSVVTSRTRAMMPHLESTVVVPKGDHFAHSPSAVPGERGRIVLAYVQGIAKDRANRKGSSIWLRVSTDGGRNWGNSRVVVSGDDTVAFGKPSLVRLSDGRLGMSYSQFTLDQEGRLPGSGNRVRLFQHSTDEGTTWSEPSHVGKGSSNNDALVVGTGGRLIQALLTGHTRASEPLALITASDDLGVSWRQLSRSGAGPAAQPTGESDLAHLGGGRLVLLSRPEAPFYCLNFSADNGLTWDGPHSLWLGGGDNPPKIARIPGTETLVAVVHSYTDGTKKKDRRQLASVISTDGGRTWDNFRLIGFAPDGKNGFLQHSLMFQNDEALLFYSDGSRGDTNESKNLRLIRLHRNFFTSRTRWPYDWRGEPYGP